MSEHKTNEASDAAHLETVAHVKTYDDVELTNAAREGARRQEHLTIRECFKYYPKAIAWSLLVSTCVIMEGYDTILIGNFYAYPTFAHKYGTFDAATKNYQLTAAWQSGLSNASGVGAFFGVLLNGILTSRFGMKRVILASLVILAAFIFMTFLAPNVGVLLAGEILCGLPWGVFATIAPAYASEVLPMPLRVYLTSYTNMCFIIGQLIAAGVLDGLVSNPTQWGYRIPFAIQWVWPVLLFPILLFAPESPWHLVRYQRYEEAEHSLRRLQSKSADIDVKHTLATIIHTNALEVQLAVGTTYWDCFKGFERRRTEIACVAFAGQIFSGLIFAYNSTYFFEQIHLPTSITYKLNVGGTALALFGTLVNWLVLMPNLGRRTIYVWGAFVMAVILLIIGILQTHTSNHRVGLTQAILTLVWTFVFQLSIGQLGWSTPAEIGSSRLRQKTVCLARNAYYVASVVITVIESYCMNPLEWNLRGYTSFIWCGTCFLLFIWAYFRYPETKRRSYEELDIMFAKGVGARNFKGYQVDAYEEHEKEELRRYSVH